MRKLAFFLAAILTLNLTAPAAVAYAAPVVVMEESIVDAEENETEEESVTETEESVEEESVEESVVEESSEEISVEETMAEETTAEETVTEEVVEETATEETGAEETTEEMTETETEAALTENVLPYSTDKSYLVDKTPDAFGNYDGDYLVIVNNSTTATGYSDIQTSSDSGSHIMGYDEYGNPLIDPASVLPEPIVDYEAVASGDYGPNRNTQPVSVTYTEGYRRSFVLETGADTYSKVDCVCISIGEHCTLWVPVDDPIYEEDLFYGTNKMKGYMNTLAEEFDSQYERMVTMFGSTDYVDENYADGDGKTAILCYDLEGDGENFTAGSYLAGYFWGADLDCPFSNATGNKIDCIHIDSYQGMRRDCQANILQDPTSSKGTMVHELQHMIFFTACRIQESGFYTITPDVWMNEAYSAAAQHLCYGESESYGRISTYNSSSLIPAGWPLAVWNGNLENYALVYMFSQYMRVQYEALGNDGETVYKKTLAGLNSANRDLFAIIASTLETTKEELLLDYRIALQLKNAKGRYGFGGEGWVESLSSNRYYTGGSNYLEYYGAGIVTKNDGSYTSGINLDDYAVAGVNTEVAEEDISVSISGGDSISSYQGTLQLSATVLPSTISQAVQWSITSGKDCATINVNTGLVTAVQDGTVTVRATSVLLPSAYAEKTITITNQTECVKITKQENSYEGGRWVNYTPVLPVDAELYYTLDGSNPTVSDEELPSEGLFFEEEGEYHLRVLGHDPSGAYADGYEEYKFAIEKTEEPVIEASEIVTDGFVTYSVKITAEEEANIYYTLDGSEPTVDAGIAYTDEIVVEESGTTNIKAIAIKTGYVSSDVVSKKVTVHYKVTEITLDNEEVLLYTNGEEGTDSIVLHASILPQESECEIEWSSDNEAVATVDENGLVRAISKGRATISAKADDCVATCVVVVSTYDFTIRDGVLIEYNGTDAEVTIPDGVVEIGREAFANCNEVENIILNDTVEIIGDYAFFRCGRLREFDFKEGIKEIGEGAFAESAIAGNITIPTTVTLIKGDAFLRCNNLVEVEFANGENDELQFVNTGNGAAIFSDCYNLKTVILPDRLSVLPTSTFQICDRLNTVYIPETVSEFADDVFMACYSVIIYGVPGSAAEIYANANGIPFKNRVELGWFPEELYLNRTKVDVSEREIGNTVALKVTIKPLDILNKKVTYESLDTEVATVDDSGIITIVNCGETDIIVTSLGNNQLSASCHVTVRKEWTSEEVDSVREYIESNNNFVVLTNIYDSLQNIDIMAPEGINAEWKLPYDIAAGNKGYDIVLQKAGYEDYILTDVIVKGIKVTGIAILSKQTVEAGESLEAIATVISEGGELDKENYQIRWKSSNASNATVTPDKNNALSAVITGIKKGSNATITTDLILLKDGKEFSTEKEDFGTTWFSTSVKIAVAKDVVADDIAISVLKGEDTIDIESLENLVNVTEKEVYTLSAKAMRSGEEIEEATLTWKSSNIGVATVKSQNDGMVALTVLGKGTAVITATAKNNGGYVKTFRVSVKDSTPRLVEKNITINAYRTDASGYVQILPSDGYLVDLDSLAIVTADNEEAAFEIEHVENHIYKVSVKEDKKADLKKGNHAVKILVTTNALEETSCELALKIKVEKKSPNVSIKQNPINLYEEDGRGLVEVISDEIIKEIDYVPKVDTGVRLEAEEYTGGNVISIKAVGANANNYTKAAAKGTLRIQFEGYVPEADYVNTITLSVNKKTPVITATLDSATLYPQTLADSTEIHLINKATGEEIFFTDGFEVETGTIPATYEYTEHTDSDLPRITALNGAAKTNITYKIRHEDWYEGIEKTATCTVKIGKAPTLLLGTGKVIFNTAYTVGDYDMVSMDTFVKGFEQIELTSMEIVGKNAKSQKLLDEEALVFELHNGVVQGGISDRKYFTKAGNYTYVVTAYDDENMPVTGTLKVSIVLAKNKPEVTFKTKGNINLLDRENTQTIATPTVKNYSGKVVNADLDGANADKFNVDVEDGNIIIKAQEYESIKAKANYNLSMDVELDSGVVLKTKVKVTPKQTNPKLSQNVKEIVLFETAKGMIFGEDFLVDVADGQAGEIESIRLVTDSDTFAYDEITETVYVKETPSLKPEKKYTLKFEVRFKDAGINVKPVAVSLKVDYRK